MLVLAAAADAVVLLGRVRELEVEREGAEHLGLVVRLERADGLAHDRRVADLARLPRGGADLLLGGEELLALLLDEHLPEQRAEQADVAPQRAVRLLEPRLVARALLRVSAVTATAVLCRTAYARTGAAAPRTRRAHEQRGARAEREQLLGHHHEPRELLVLQRLRAVAVGREERLRREQEQVAEHLPEGEQRARERQPSGHRERARAPPGRRAGSRRAAPAATNERCSTACARFVGDGVVVGRRDVPGGVCAGPRRERDPRARQQPGRTPERRPARDGAGRERRQQEEEQRPAHARARAARRPRRRSARARACGRRATRRRAARAAAPRRARARPRTARRGPSRRGRSCPRRRSRDERVAEAERRDRRDGEHERLLAHVPARRLTSAQAVAGGPGSDLAAAFARARRARPRAPASRSSTSASALTQRGSNAGAGLLAQQRHRLLVRPRRPVDARRDQRVVDVADGEDPRVEIDRVGRRGRSGSPAPSSRSWWSRTSRRTVFGKPPIWSSSRVPHSGWRLTTAYSSSSSGPGFLQDHVGDGELADVVQQPADRERAEVPLRQAEALADLHGPQRDPARVLLGVGVALPELDRRARGRASRGSAPRSARARPRRGRRRAGATARCGEVERDRDPDDEDAVELDRRGRATSRAGRRSASAPATSDVREPDDADRDHEVGDPPREQEGAERAHREDREEGEADRRAAAIASVLFAAGTGGTRLRQNEGRERRARGRASSRTPSSTSSGFTPRRHARQRQHRERQDRGADRAASSRR